MSDHPEAAFRAYLKAFETLDPEQALPFFHVPGMFVSSQGVYSVPDVATARSLLSGFMAQMKTQSYDHTRVENLTVRTLSADLASCAGVFVRMSKTGEQLARVGFTYTLRYVGSWKIVVAILHAPTGA